MRSSGNAGPIRTAATACCLGLVCLTGGAVLGQSQAKSLYEDAVQREASLRNALSATSATPASDVLHRVRTLVGSYEDMARLFPTVGYGDKALWQGAMLSGDAFRRFGDAADRGAALQLLESLTTGFPKSALAKKAPSEIKRLAQAGVVLAAAAPPVASVPPSAAPPSARPVPPVATRAAAGTTANAASPTVTLTSIRRESLQDTLRVTLELDREVPFHDEQIDGPPRVFLDFHNTRAVPALRDAALPFDDPLLHRVRVGRQLDSRTRVVLDLKTLSRYSVYTLYNPYRVVIDFERGHPPLPAAATEARATPSTPAKPTTTVTPSTAATGKPTDAAIAPPSANAGGNYSLSRQLGLGAARIVIDPGHGGHDPGAKARGLSEAELVLDIALRLESLLLKQQGIEVVLTRRTDGFVPLEQRTEIANRENADLFLSIHANASDDAAARGIETYFLNFAPNPEAEAVAARENAGAARNMRHLPEIVKAIALNNKIDESRDFATAVQRSLHNELRKMNNAAKNLGVKQAPFMVLIGATMPSILAEVSFITNRQDASLLKGEKYRQRIAEALLAGVMRYQQSLKKQPTVATR